MRNDAALHSLVVLSRGWDDFKLPRESRLVGGIANHIETNDLENFVVYYKRKLKSGRIEVVLDNVHAVVIRR